MPERYTAKCICNLHIILRDICTNHAPKDFKVPMLYWTVVNILIRIQTLSYQSNYKERWNYSCAKRLIYWTTWRPWKLVLYYEVISPSELKAFMQNIVIKTSLSVDNTLAKIVLHWTMYIPNNNKALHIFILTNDYIDFKIVFALTVNPKVLEHATTSGTFFKNTGRVAQRNRILQGLIFTNRCTITVDWKCLVQVSINNLGNLRIWPVNLKHCILTFSRLYVTFKATGIVHEVNFTQIRLLSTDVKVSANRTVFIFGIYEDPIGLPKA